MLTARSAWLAALLLVATGPGDASGATRPKPPAPEKPSAPVRNGPALYLPTRADSVSIESEPAPLLRPGQPMPVDSTIQTPRDRAREQLTLGVVMERQGNFPGALLAYMNAAKFDSTLREASFRRGLLEVKWGRLD